MICATSKLDIICRKKEMFKSWGILEAGACDHGPGPPWNRAEHNSCIAGLHMKLLSNGAEHHGAHPLPAPSQGLHRLHVLQHPWTNNRRHHQLSPQDSFFPPLQITAAPFQKAKCLQSWKHSEAPLRLYPSVLYKAKSQLALIKYGLKQPFADTSLKT